MKKCNRCHKFHDGPLKTCEVCRPKAKELMRKNRLKHKDNGICIRCCILPAQTGYTECSKCKEGKSILQSPYRAICTERECFMCGYSVVVHIHHIDGIHSNNSRDNLVALCPNHHAEAELGLIPRSTFYSG